MEKSPLISVIIPMYNVEKYLRQFLDSLVNQTLKNIEIILVNDASPDNCHEIVSKSYLNDTRIKYINKKVNEGLWKARQSGYEFSRGKYIINLDPDDLIDVNFLEELYVMAENHDLDFVLSNVSIIDENSNIISKTQLPDVKVKKFFKNEKDYRLLLGTAYATWFRLVRKKVLSDYSYRYEMGELMMFSLQFCDNIKVGINPLVSYYYRKHSSSVSNHVRSSIRLSETKEYEGENLNRKIKQSFSFPISSVAKRKMLNLYTYRVFYSLIMISWLYKKPSKSYKKDTSNMLKKTFKVSFFNNLSYLRFFKKNDFLFIILTSFYLDFIVFNKLVSKKDI